MLAAVNCLLMQVIWPLHVWRYTYVVDTTSRSLIPEAIGFIENLAKPLLLFIGPA